MEAQKTGATLRLTHVPPPSVLCNHQACCVTVLFMKENKGFNQKVVCLSRRGAPLRPCCALNGLIYLTRELALSLTHLNPINTHLQVHSSLSTRKQNFYYFLFFFTFNITSLVDLLITGNCQKAAVDCTFISHINCI